MRNNGGVAGTPTTRCTIQSKASDPHLDLTRAPYCLYGVKYIDLVSLNEVVRHNEEQGSDPHLDLSRAPCVLYGGKYIGLVSLAALFNRPAKSQILTRRASFCSKRRACGIPGAAAARALDRGGVSGSRLDLIRAPYVLYGVKYIDLVSLQLLNASGSHLHLIRAPYVLYGVKYIDLVSFCAFFQDTRPESGVASASAPHSHQFRKAAHLPLRRRCENKAAEARGVAHASVV